MHNTALMRLDYDASFLRDPARPSHHNTIRPFRYGVVGYPPKEACPVVSPLGMGEVDQGKG